MNTDILDMSDDEIMNMSNPPQLDETPENTQESDGLSSNSDNSLQYDANAQELESNNEYNEENPNYTTETSDKIENQDNNDTPNYEEFYKTVMAPFKANGRMVQLNNAQEVISLMQKGTDYTRKTQDLARYKKPLLMLEKAKLLDEDNVSFYIDLMNGNQEAIRKLLKDKNIDTFSLPSDEEPINYVPGPNTISDVELAIDDTVRDIESKPYGNSFINDVYRYDNRSKAYISQDPRIMEVLFQQKQSGIYDKIVTEVERQKIIGNISPNTPFIDAYYSVGSMMLRQQGNNQQGRNGLNTLQPLTRRPAITPSNLNNSQRARAAGITRTSSQARQAIKNPLSMSDEEFLKQFGE